MPLQASRHADPFSRVGKPLPTSCEANVSAPLLMAISGHKRLATLQRYVKPSPAAVAALMAASDPDRRGR